MLVAAAQFTCIEILRFRYLQDTDIYYTYIVEMEPNATTK